MQEIPKELETQHHELLFTVRKSVRYHTYRRKFYDAFQQVSTGLSLIMGSATVGLALKAYTEITVFTGAIVTIVSIVNLILKTSEKSRSHSDLAKKFIEIEKSVTSTEKIDAASLRKWNTDVLTIEAEEPPIKLVLDAKCHNELIRAYNLSQDYKVKVGFFQNAFAQFFDLYPSKLTPKIQLDPTHNQPKQING